MNKRSSFATSLPRAVKSTAGRTLAPQVPANIRVFGVHLDSEERAAIRLGLGAKLGKYATDIERVSVRMLDANGPRGGVDQVCRIKVVLSGLPSIVFEAQASTTADAVNGALAGIERSVRRSLQRRPTIPRKASAARRPVLGASAGRRAGP